MYLPYIEGSSVTIWEFTSVIGLFVYIKCSPTDQGTRRLQVVARDNGH